MYSFIKWTRTFFNTTALSTLNPSEVSPGTNRQTLEEIFDYLIPGGGLSLSPTFAHPSCSCPMMPKEKGGCVGPDLKMYGVKNLRIIDGSIIPIIPAAHLQASLYAVAEKAADLIKGVA